MRRLIIQTLILLAGLVLLLVPAAQVLAKDKPAGEEGVGHLVIGSHDGQITIDTDGPELTVTMTENGKSRVAVVDLEQIGMMVEDSVGELARALASMQMEFRLGQDNNLSLALDDEEWEVDLDAIMGEVAMALEGAFDGAFDDLDTGDWAHHRHHRTIDQVSEEELKAELDGMRQELQALKKELASLKRKEADN